MGYRFGLCVALLCSAPALADYEGKITISLPASSSMQQMQGDVHFKKGKLRMDYRSPIQMSIVHDSSGKKTFQLFPKTKTYNEIDPAKAASGSGSSQQYPTCKDYSNVEKCFSEMGFTKAGTEKANGFESNVYTKDLTLKNGDVQHLKLWRPLVAKDVLFVKQTVDGKDPNGNGEPFHMEINITDLKAVPQANALFEVPDDYKKAQGMGMGMGSNQKPTPEQIEELKKRAVEMQKEQKQNAQ